MKVLAPEQNKKNIKNSTDKQQNINNFNSIIIRRRRRKKRRRKCPTSQRGRTLVTCVITKIMMIS